MSPGSLSGPKPKIVPKPGGGDAHAYVELLTYAIQSITAVTGINLELLVAEKDRPGIIEHMRKQASMTVLATMFDSLRGFLKIVGRKRLFFIQTHARWHDDPWPARNMRRQFRSPRTRRPAPSTSWSTTHRPARTRRSPTGQSSSPC